MEPLLLRNGCRRAIVTCRHHISQPNRRYAIPAEPIRAAAPINFSDKNQFRRRPQVELMDDGAERRTGNRFRASGQGGRQGARRGGHGGDRQDDKLTLMRRIRIVPTSPSYFTATPRYTDDLLFLSALLRRFQTLPVLPPGDAPRVAWKTLEMYKAELAEPIRAKSYKMLVTLLKRLNYIHPSLMPKEVIEALEKFKRLVQPHDNQAKPILVDADGVSRAVGRRKSSSAAVFLVEGDGQVLVNGKSLSSYFGRLHDRESATWPLKATQRLDKYNVWALAQGGGTTGQAEAITLGLAKALLAHEPDLKTALRIAGVVTRDPRRVERKKPGKLKARKMPAWVKR